MTHPPVRLAEWIEWRSPQLRRALPLGPGPSGLVAAPRGCVLYLQHAFDASDESVVGICVEDVHSQFFTGEVYLPTDLPIHLSSLTRWRARIGMGGVDIDGVRILRPPWSALPGGIAVDRQRTPWTVLASGGRAPGKPAFRGG